MQKIPARLFELITQAPVQTSLLFASLFGLGLLGASACQTNPCCTQDSDCAQGLRCVAGSCSPSCSSDQQCLYGQHCDPKLQACVGSALRNACVWHFANEDAAQTLEDAGLAEAGTADRRSADQPDFDRGFVDGGFEASWPDDGSWPFDASGAFDGGWPYDANVLRDASGPFDGAWPFDGNLPPRDASTDDATGPVCLDDNYEDNDSIDTASLISQGYLEALFCQNDDDYYAFDVTQDQHLRLKLSIAPGTGDLDMALFNGSGNQVALSQGITQLEEIELQAPRSERYSARVYGFNQAAGPYSLDLCLDDAFEENDRMGRAPQIEVGHYDLTLCSGDSDYFRIDANPGANIVIRLSPAGPGIQADQLKLYGRGQLLLATAISASSDPELLLLSYQVQDERVLFIAVEDAGQQNTNYQLDLDLGP